MFPVPTIIAKKTCENQGPEFLSGIFASLDITQFVRTTRFNAWVISISLLGEKPNISLDVFDGFERSQKWLSLQNDCSQTQRTHVMSGWASTSGLHKWLCHVCIHPNIPSEYWWKKPNTTFTAISDFGRLLLSEKFLLSRGILSFYCEECFDHFPCVDILVFFSRAWIICSFYRVIGSGGIRVVVVVVLY